jgi:hypothetical protein
MNMSNFGEYSHVEQFSSNSSTLAKTSLDHGDHFGKKRAAKACTACRERKIRCDVSLIGLPCSNCAVNHRNCLIKERVRRRRAERPVEFAAPFGGVQTYPFRQTNLPFPTPATGHSAIETHHSPLFNASLVRPLGCTPDIEKFDAVHKSTSNSTNPMSPHSDPDLDCLVQVVGTDFNDDPFSRTKDGTLSSSGKILKELS